MFKRIWITPPITHSFSELERVKNVFYTDKRLLNKHRVEALKKEELKSGSIG